MTSDPTDH